MLGWYVRIINNEKGSIKFTFCDSYVDAMNKAVKIWNALSKDEKSKVGKYQRFIGDFNWEIEAYMYELSVVLADCNNKGKILLEDDYGIYYGMDWFYRGFEVQDSNNNQTVEFCDTYNEAKRKIRLLNAKESGERYIMAHGDLEDVSAWTTGKYFDFFELTLPLGMSDAELSRKFGIPIRTIENWNSEKTEPNDYILGMLAKEFTEYGIRHHVFDGVEEIFFNPEEEKVLDIAKREEKYSNDETVK